MFKLFINYTTIGAINTLIGYFMIFYLTYLQILPEVANLLGYIVGFFISYILNKKYNFKSKVQDVKELPRFIISMTISYGLNLLILILFYRFLDVNVYISQIIASIVYLFSGFLLSYFYAFNLKK